MAASNPQIDSLLEAARIDSFYRKTLDADGNPKNRDWQSAWEALKPRLKEMSVAELMALYAGRGSFPADNNEGFEFRDEVANWVTETICDFDLAKIKQGRSVYWEILQNLDGYDQGNWSYEDAALATFMVMDRSLSSGEVNDIVEIIAGAYGHRFWDEEGMFETCINHPKISAETLAVMFMGGSEAAGRKLVEKLGKVSRHEASDVYELLSEAKKWDGKGSEELYRIHEQAIVALLQNPVIIDDWAVWRAISESQTSSGISDIDVRVALHEYDDGVKTILDNELSPLPLRAVMSKPAPEKLAKFDYKWVGAQGVEHPLQISGAKLRCQVHNDALAGSINVTGGSQAACQELVKNWSKLLMDPDDDTLGFDDEVLLLVKDYVLLDLVKTIAESSGFSEKFVAYMLPSAPAWRQDFNWFSTWAELQLTAKEKESLLPGVMGSAAVEL